MIDLTKPLAGANDAVLAARRENKVSWCACTCAILVQGAEEGKIPHHPNIKCPLPAHHAGLQVLTCDLTEENEGPQWQAAKAAVHGVE